MAIEHIRLAQTARDQLVTLKRRTGIAHWNVLCRWALCRSLAEPAPPPAVKLVLDSSVEMTGKRGSGCGCNQTPPAQGHIERIHIIEEFVEIKASKDVDDGSER